MRAAAWLASCAALAGAGAASAQEAPTIDTEDATLGSVAVGGGRFHPTLAIDLRNGDFSRGDGDDDPADLDRLPVHIQLGLAYDLHRNARGETDAFLVLNSSNGLHAPARDERASPRAWYESNNALALILAPADGLRAGLAYTVKSSPNGVSPTTHEVSATFSYKGDRGPAALNPSLVATMRPKGGHGLFTQIGMEPEFATTAREDGPAFSLPARLGVGWGGFYDPGGGDAAYGSLGLAYSHPLEVGRTRWRLRSEVLAVLRDPTLRRLGDAGAERSTVVPLATLSLTVAY